MRKIFVPACFVFFGFFMIIVVLQLSPVGDSGAGFYYNKNAVSDTNSMNTVCAMILDYRGYDTLIESAVFFTAIICVLSVLFSGSENGFFLDEYWDPGINVTDITRRMTPFILLFGIYIILHGHLSTGGGFQGGVVIGAGFIIYTTVFGLEKARNYAPEDIVKITNSLGISIFVSIGLLGIIAGYNFLSNKVAGIPPVGQPGVLLSAGTLLGINIGIGMNVASTIIRLFFAFQEEGGRSNVK